MPSASGRRTETRTTLAAVPLDAVGGRLAPVVVDADDRGAVALHAGDQPLLDRGVVLHGAVAVEMVRRDVEQDADASDRARARGRSGRTSISITW